MEAKEENSWNSSIWFNEWLLLARERNPDAEGNERDEERGEEKGEEYRLHGNPSPLVEWIYSVQEHATLRLPRLSPKLEIAVAEKIRFDIPHALAR
ncbi:MAG: hypothetical protein JWQ71_3773 [Pedosphaera sp.]|nr:hypothetical protein [Pedosphaera sp.]